MMRLRLTVTGAAVALLAAAPGAHAAPTLQPVKRCYVSAAADEREPIEIHGSGFSRSAMIDTYIDDVPVPPPPGTPTPMTDIVGDIEGSVLAPYYPSGQRMFTLRLTEHDNPANSAAVTSKVTALSVEQLPTKPQSTSTQVRFRGRGFTAIGAVYAHYVFHTKSVKTVRLAKPYGACGLFSRKLRQFPFARPPKEGEWTIVFDQVQHYDPAAPVKFSVGVEVRRKIKPPN